MMRNRILSITRNTIPYVKEVMPLAQSVTGCILMQQLDYWFERYPNGFYKFQDAAPDHAAYKTGESWVEELGFSPAEFRTAFDKVGVRHKSKKDFVASADPFEGKFYCCYYDRLARLTYYHRNHVLLDKCLDDLMRAQPHAAEPQPGPAGKRPFPVPNAVDFSEKTANLTATEEPSSPRNEASSVPRNQHSVFPGNAESALLGNQGTQSTVDAGSSSPDVTNLELQEMQSLKIGITETTFSKTTKLQQPEHASSGRLVPPTADETRCGGDNDFENLIFPPQLALVERDGLIAALRKCDAHVHQDLLDEIAGVQAAKGFRMGMVPFAHALVRAADEGRFVLTAGVAIRKVRENRRANGFQVAAADAALTAKVRPLSQISDAELSKYPPNMRRRMEEARAKELGNSVN
ncbi:hypothetical protein ACT2FY_39005 [Paraburkholderia fungorum]|uniref:hypothetical protein n=1 Tax=Paraburkholderia fungorum TaxID=134537 RepID=UPI00402BD76C